jgi:hypothetical protein
MSRSLIPAELAATSYLAPYALAKPRESPGKLGSTMAERPGKHIGPRPRARHWRTALVWVAALAALALAAWIATRAALALSG